MPQASSDSRVLSPEPRVLWVDALRGEMVLLVVVFHSTGLLRYSKADTPRVMPSINNLSEPYWMPTLSFVAGMLAERAKTDARAQYGATARNVLYPFAVWTSVYAIAFQMPANADTVLQISTGGNYLFFLAFLFGFHTAGHLLGDTDPRWLTAGALAVSGIAPGRLPNVPERFTRGFWYLLAMYALGQRMSRDAITWQRLLASRVALWTGTVAMVAGSLATVYGRRISYRAQWAWLPALAIIPLVRANRRVEDRAFMSPLRFVGRNAIVYYTTHFPVAYATIRGLHRHGVSSGRRTLLAALGASVAVPTAVSLARHRGGLIQRLFAV